MTKKRINLPIVPYRSDQKPQLLSVWERSVKATHHFLSQPDFEAIKLMLQELDLGFLDVLCAMEQEELVGFIGIAAQKIEMLFIAPEYFGQGIGKRLVSFAVERMNVTRVDVNEQNDQAIGFYRNMGFEVYERTPVDGQGKPYPLYRMELTNIPG